MSETVINVSSTNIWFYPQPKDIQFNFREERNVHELESEKILKLIDY